MKKEILLPMLLLFLAGCVGGGSSSSEPIKNEVIKSEKPASEIKEETGILTTKIKFKDADSEGVIKLNKLTKKAEVDFVIYLNDTEEWVEFFGENVTAAPFMVNTMCGILAVAFFNESALKEMSQSGNITTEQGPSVLSFLEGYKVTQSKILFKDKETGENIAECIAVGPRWEDITFKAYRDYSGYPSLFGMEIGKKIES